MIQPLLAYIGPGAGVALLSSFLVILTTMVLVVSRSQLASAKQRLSDLDDDARRDYAMAAWIR